MNFDYIVVGGGSGGCVLAARLSEDPSVSVALIEAGPADKNVLIHCPAGLALLAQTQDGELELRHGAAEGPERPHRLAPRGKVLGGSSSVNAMVYIRGHRADYDHWAAEGNEGWSYDEVLPYFRRAEHNERLARRVPRQRRPAQRDGPAQPQPLRAGLHRGRPRGGLPHHRRLQRRRPGRHRPVPGHAQERRALQRRQGLPHAQPRPQEPARCSPRRTPRASCSRASARPASSSGARAACEQIGAQPRGADGRRRAADAADPDAVGRRPGRGARAGTASASSTTCPASARTCTTTSTPCR